ncbi:BMP family protein [Roseobacter sp.]|uniref:BMP family protein n=1 Tax=Roseobacter sp. TaxID=1907202 RepID=UPI003859E0C8
MKIAVLFVGEVHDRGFNQCALEGVERMRAAGAAEIEIVSGVSYQPNAMTTALETSAARADGVIFIGGQGNGITPPVAASFPDRSFAVVQGNVTGANLASYDVLQEQSAFLAGVAAARLTQSGVVGHLSGHRVSPGLKGRAAFSSGLRHVDENIRLVTGFCGTQDDNETTDRWARGIADTGADILFTMLNAARDGAIDACQATGMRQIGNATDWCAVDADVFVASAVARIDLGVERAVINLLAGRCPDQIEDLGLAQNAVELTCAPDVPEVVREEVNASAEMIAARQLEVETVFNGPEFELGQ